jgi:N-methylhydantoinase B
VSSTPLDPVRLEVFHHLFAAAAEEMGAALMRSAFSANIKERRDFSCALFDGDGLCIAQAAHLPVHLGSSPLSLEAARAALHMRRGDVVVLNDPFEGGTHLPDITLVTPVYTEDASEADFYCLVRAHHADVGGAFPGSMAPARDVHGEGLRIPPVRLIREGELDEGMWRLILANMRVQREREGDLRAQLASCRVGASRLEAMIAEYGVRETRERGAQLMDWTERLMRETLSELPRGTVRFEDVLELEGDERISIRLELEVGQDGARFDFRTSDDSGAGSVNTVRAVTLSAVFYVMRLLLPPDTPTNDGIMRCVDVQTRPGSVVDARYPAAVAAGNVETSQRLVDVILGALGKLVPGRFPAASAGTMSNLTIGGEGDGGAFAYYETIAGGAGGGPQADGEHALQTHMTNTLNTPIESLEAELPLRVESYTVRRGSGGAGMHPGGDGVIRHIRLLAAARVGWIAERQTQGPWGSLGGASGSTGSARVLRPGQSEAELLAGKVGIELPAGSSIEVRTPGGGGYGAPESS